MRISDWSSDVCSSDLAVVGVRGALAAGPDRGGGVGAGFSRLVVFAHSENLMSLVVRLNCGNAALERALPRVHGPVADRKELGLSLQALEVGGVGEIGRANV